MTDLQLIEQYILEKKGIKIVAIPPRNEREFMIFAHMLSFAKEYFLNKNK